MRARSQPGRKDGPRGIIAACVLAALSPFLAFSCAYPSGRGMEEIPLFSHPSGIYDGPFDLVLRAEEGSTIYYTLDGSDPDPARVDAPVLDPATHAQTFAYSGPMRVEKKYAEVPSIADIPTTRPTPYKDGFPVWQAPSGPIEAGWTVRAIAMKDGRTISEGYVSYIFSRHPEAFTISLIVPPRAFFDPDEGFYIMGPTLNAYRLEDVEAQGKLEIFDERGRAVSSASVGIRVGGTMREQPNKALDVFFRSEYGVSRIGAPLFGERGGASVKRLILRTGGHQDYQWSTISDAIAQSGLALAGVDYQRWRFSVIYLNGIYWGMVNIREKVDEDFVRLKYGLDAELFPALDFFNNTRYVSGDGEHYDAMIDQCSSAAASEGGVSEEELDSISQCIDVGNYVTMIAARIALACGEMPGDHNDKRWRIEPGTYSNPMADGRWRWMLFDFDNCLYEDPSSNDFIPACENAIGPIRYLLTNRGFRERLVNRVLDLSYIFFESGRYASELSAARRMMLGSLPEHIARWGYPATVGEWSYRMDMMDAFIAKRPEYLHDQAAGYFGFADGSSTVEVRRSAGAANCVVLCNDDTKAAGLYAYREADSQARRYFNGTSVTLDALAGPGYEFAGWSDGVAEAKRKIDVAGDVFLTAVFTKERE